MLGSFFFFSFIAELIFLFVVFVLSRRIFFADFVADFFSSFLWGKWAHKNPPGKSPTKSSRTYTAKIPDTFLPEGPGQQMASEA